MQIIACRTRTWYSAGRQLSQARLEHTGGQRRQGPSHFKFGSIVGNTAGMQTQLANATEEPAAANGEQKGAFRCRVRNPWCSARVGEASAKAEEGSLS